MSSFSIVYRTGGTMACKWMRILETYPTYDVARAKAADIERGGYPCHIYRTRDLNTIGMPIGYDPREVDHELDEIYYSPYMTSWRHRDLLK